MKFLILLIGLLFSASFTYGQDCKYAQCSTIKSNGYQCLNCVSEQFDMQCSSHKPSTTYQQPTYNPPKPLYESTPKAYECQYSECIATKSNGEKCRKCTGSNFTSYCSSHAY